MKKSYFILAFTLLSFLLLYSDNSVAEQVKLSPDGECNDYNAYNCPLDRCKIITTEITKTVIGCSNKELTSSCVNKPEGEFCYLADTPGLLSIPNYYEHIVNVLYGKRPMRLTLIFENKILSYFRFKEVREGFMRDSTLPVSEEQKYSTENCKTYKMPVKRNGGTLSYNLPLSEQRTVSAYVVVNPDLRSGGQGTTSWSCIYRLTNEIIEEIKPLGVVASDICPDLQRGGRPVEDPNPNAPCPATARCDVTIPEGEEENYALGIEEDACGNSVIKTLNDGNPVSEDNVPYVLGEFAQSCSERYAKECDVPPNTVCPANNEEGIEGASACSERKVCKNFKINCDPCIPGMGTGPGRSLFGYYFVKFETCTLHIHPDLAELLGLKSNQIISYDKLKAITQENKLDDASVSRCLLAHELSHADICQETEVPPYLCTDEEIASNVEAECLQKIWDGFCRGYPNEVTPPGACSEVKKRLEFSRNMASFQRCLCKNPGDGISSQECKECIDNNLIETIVKYGKSVPLIGVRTCNAYCRKLAYDPSPSYCSSLFNP